MYFIVQMLYSLFLIKQIKVPYTGHLYLFITKRLHQLYNC